MTPISKQAAKMVEAHVGDCNEFEIHSTIETSEDFIKKYPEYTVIEKVYWGEPTALSEVIERDLFEYFRTSKEFKHKLKNSYVPNARDREAPNGVSIFVIAKR